MFIFEKKIIYDPNFLEFGKIYKKFVSFQMLVSAKKVSAPKPILKPNFV